MTQELTINGNLLAHYELPDSTDHPDRPVYIKINKDFSNQRGMNDETIVEMCFLLIQVLHFDRLLLVKEVLND